MAMPDEEIKKALECCMNEDGSLTCRDCPLCNCSKDCLSVKAKNTIDLINRQKAEIERLGKILENRGEICKLCEGKYTEKIKHAKSEAYKEFAHLLIDKAKKGVICAMDIPDYVKEIGG